MSDAKPARVLVVEDNDASAGDCVRWLRSDGLLVERAAAASDAEAKAAAFGPDVVLLDLQIPRQPYGPGASSTGTGTGTETMIEALRLTPRPTGATRSPEVMDVAPASAERPERARSSSDRPGPRRSERL